MGRHSYNVWTRLIHSAQQGRYGHGIVINDKVTISYFIRLLYIVLSAADVDASFS